MSLAMIATLIETIISDAPTLINVVEKLIPIFKENRAPTDAEWSEINNLVDATHKKLQGE